MIHALKCHLSWVAALFIIVGVLGNSCIPAHGQTSVVSIPSFQISDGERVVGFEIHIKSGRIASLPVAPIGWNIRIDNDPSWNTSIIATTEVGAASLNRDFFQKFLIIEKNEFGDNKFDLEGEVIVTKDFQSERRIKLKIEDFLVSGTVSRLESQK